MRLSELRSAMSNYAAEFDPARVAATDAARVVEDAAAIKNMAATVEALAAARVTETALWKRDGDRLAAHQLARTTGTSLGQARESLEVARRLQHLPATAGAARRGELSAQQVAVIADAAGANPDVEARLLAQSKTASFGELRDECARTKANASDLEARRRRIHERRYLRVWDDAEGGANLHLRDNRRLGPDPHHRLRAPRPLLLPPPRPQDHRGLGTRRGPRQTRLRPTRRSRHPRNAHGPSAAA